MRMASTHLGFTAGNVPKLKGRGGVMQRMPGNAKVSPSPLAVDRTGKARVEEPPEDEELVEGGEGLGKTQEPLFCWDELPGVVLELVFNHLKAAAIRGEDVFLKSGDEQRRVTAVGVRLGAVCRSWQAEARYVFFKDWWRTPNSIIHPRQCFSLAPEPQALFQCEFEVQEDQPSRHCLYRLHESTSAGKVLMSAEFNKEGAIEVYQHGRKWQEHEGPCAVVKVGRYNMRYALEATAPEPSGKRACLASIKYVDRIKACLSPRKMQVTLPGREALRHYDPCPPTQSAESGGVSGTKPKGAAVEAASVRGFKGFLSSFGASKGAARTGPSNESRGREQILVNREPEFKPEFRGWCLNFKGRVQDPSVKNFQLVDAADPSEIILQFGRVKGHTYILDFQPHAISAAQAFAIALSNFHR